ncbi:MAG: sugar nucleotide-binding protein, partial [Candidatus Omnitrophica bacterium]|nr:sugar nucleotide-binding protein [Candidatus Omnitrophota bacterium]
DQRGSPTYTLDLAAGIKELTDRPLVETESKIYHITNSGVCSWHDLACKAVEYAGIKGVKVKPIPTLELNPSRPALRPEMSALDNSRYNRLIGRPLRPWSEALKSYIMLDVNK